MSDDTETFPVAPAVWQAMPQSVAAALNAVMADLGPLAKRGKNPHHNYKYVTIGDLMAELQPALTKHKLAVVQTEVEWREVRNTLAVRYAFGLVHTGTGEVWACPMQHTGMAALVNSRGGVDDKAANKAHTAARKYFLLGLFQIPTLEEGDERLHDGDTDRDEDRPAGPQPDPRGLARKLETFRRALEGCRSYDEAEALWLENEALLRELPAAALASLVQVWRDRGTEPPDVPGLTYPKPNANKEAA